MQVSKIQSANNVNFNARFIENAKYKELYQYAKQQKTFPKFEKVIKHLETLPDSLVKLDYGKTKIQQDCDYGGRLKLGLVPFVEKTFVKFTKDGNDINSKSIYLMPDTSPVEAAYKKILSLFDSNTELYKYISGAKMTTYNDWNYILKKGEMKLVKIVENWNNQDKDIFAKFKGDFHTYPTKKNNRIADKMSILEYLDKVKESRFFDFDSEYLSDKSLYNEFMLLRQELNRKRTEVTTEEIERFLYDVSQDKELGQKMVKEFAGNPRETENIKNKIIKLLGNNANAQDKFYKWYHDEVQGYKSAYKNYYINLYNDATSLMTLVKESPNIAPWAFVSKANELNVEPTLGKLPKKFGNLDEYRTLISELIKFDKDYQNKYTKNRYKKIKVAEHYITINDKLFKIEKLHGGMSAKTKYKVTPDGDDMYIIKFNEYDAIGNTWRSTQIRENQAMRADSPYLDAMVDFYLKENNSPNVATVEFFDNKSKSVIYKPTQGETLNSTDKNIYNLYLFNNSKLVEDLKKLGITLNDVNVGNFIVDQQGNNILIDTGHVDYSLMFRPMVPGKHISLSNLCGRSL